MDGVHDLGGLDGFGPVDRHPAEPVFGEDWERRTFRLMVGSVGRWAPTAGSSATRSSGWTPPITCPRRTTSTGSPASRHSPSRPARQPTRARAPRRRTLPAIASRRGDLPDDLTRTEPRYTVGDDVRVREWHPPGHTRAPRYVQGKRGTIVRVDGAYNVADIEAHGGGFVTDPTYSVRFTSRELWGEGGADGKSSTSTCGSATSREP